MASSTQHVKEAVQRALDELPAEKIEEVLEFALFLKARWSAHKASTAIVSEPAQPSFPTVPATHLDRLTGLVAWGRTS